MKNCFNRLKVTTLFAMMVATLSCTSVDNKLGTEFIPDDQTMKLRMAEFSGGMETYTVKTDSLPSKNLGYLVFGKRYNSEFGQTVASTFTSFIPDGFKHEDIKFGYNPVVDSVSILLSIFNASASTVGGEFGPQNIEQEFGVFQATKVLSPDSTYYSTIDPSTFVSTKPLFTFKHKGTLKEEVILETVALTPEGKVFINEIITSSAEELDSDTLFINKFKGLYITPMNHDKEDAVIYYSKTRTSESALLSSSIILHYRNYKKDMPIVPANINDTLSQSFSFTDAPEFRKLAFAVVKHDYSGSVVEPFIAKSPSDTIKGTPGQQRVFIQNMAGVNSFMRFSDEFCEKINAYKSLDGVEYSRIIINSAKLYFDVKSASDISVLNSAQERLGMYGEYKGYLPIPTPDYDYIYEFTNDVELQYGGHLNRVKGRYEMNITSYVQWLISNHEDKDDYSGVRREAYLAPIYYSIGSANITSIKSNAAFQSYSQVEIIGSTSPLPDDNVNSVAPKLELTYTLVK